MRDEFSQKTKELLAKRVAYQCSNPDCRRITVGPHTDPDRSTLTGEAAHITAASKGGPRYDETLGEAERKSAENGIWCCRYCARIVDTDDSEYTVEQLKNWKRQAEDMASEALKKMLANRDESEFAKVSEANMLGLECGMILKRTRDFVRYAEIFNMYEPGLDFYSTTESGALKYHKMCGCIARFMVQKSEGVSYVIVNSIIAVTHERREFEPCTTVQAPTAYEAIQYMVEVANPLGGRETKVRAVRYHEPADKQGVGTFDHNPLVIETELPGTIDVRFTARTPGIYKVSLHVVVSHNLVEKQLEVMSPRYIAFIERGAEFLA